MTLNSAAYPAWIANANKVISLYGEWPSFHDSEVVSLSLDREGPSLTARVSLCKVHHSEVDARGHFRTTDHSVITFRFVGIEELSIEGFNHQNVLSAILFEQVNGRVRVNMDGIFGATVQFQCAAAFVEDVSRREGPLDQSRASDGAK